MPIFEAELEDGWIIEVDAPNAEMAMDAVDEYKVATQYGQAPEGMVLDPETGQMVDAGAIAEQQNSSFLGKLGTAGATAVEGMPVVGAYMRDIAGMGDPVQKEVASQRMDQFAKERPITAGALNVAGAVSAVAPAVAAAPAAFGAGSGRMMVRSLASAGSGAAIGGADAAARSDGDMIETGKGAALGGAIGAAGPAVAAGVGKAVGAVWDGSKKLVAGAPARAQQSADDLLETALKRDGMTPQQATAKLKELGDNALPADLAPNLAQQAEGLATMQGPAQKTVRDTLRARTAGASERVTKAADKALGEPVDAISVADDIIARRSEQARPLYEAAYAKPIQTTKQMAEVLTTPSGKTALRKARLLAADEGKKINPASLDVMGADLVKRSLDDMITVAKRAGQTNKARVLTGIKDKLVSSVDDQVPEYAAAREIFSSHSALLEAAENGANAFSKKYPPSYIKRQLAEMSDGERDAFTQGARSAISNLMGTARNDVLAARNEFAKNNNREKLALIIGEDEASAFLQKLDIEGRFAGTANQVTGNSRTMGRDDVVKELSGEARGADSFIKSAANLNFGDALGAVGGRVGRAFAAPGIDRRNEVLGRSLMDRVQFEQAAKRLTSKGGLQPNDPGAIDRITRSLMVTRGGGD